MSIGPITTVTLCSEAVADASVLSYAAKAPMGGAPCVVIDEVFEVIISN
jgi:hypothetical protein